MKYAAVVAATIATLGSSMSGVANAADSAGFDLEAMYASKGQSAKVKSRFEGTETAKLVEQPAVKSAPALPAAKPRKEAPAKKVKAEKPAPKVKAAAPAVSAPKPPGLPPSPSAPVFPPSPSSRELLSSVSPRVTPVPISPPVVRPTSPSPSLRIETSLSPIALSTRTWLPNQNLLNPRHSQHHSSKNQASQSSPLLPLRISFYLNQCLICLHRRRLCTQLSSSVFLE